ncbi:glycine cleavage system aminomethyltransferase GcvT [Alkaliflexus imshenetskii]|uniref:glycine cleavage system aminomethyltransferase GcvT n=1 Tax=Alkaliflexus imshenetskii TaxID=286730 RepID=UPI00047B2C58|nr:glycine cleavage system aminomethyltransferase GcvT [Alkaliflexus imshenetskii]
MKKTVLYDVHLALGAKMISFAGYDMPVEYTGINSEHMAVRNAAGIFDVSHMGEFWVKGPKALEFLQKVTSNDVNRLKPGQAQYSCFPNGKGGVVDDLLVYHYSNEKYMLVVNSANIDKDWNWCQLQNTMGAEIENASDNISLIAVQGPKSASILQKLTSVNLTDIPFYSFITGNFAGVDNVIISNTGYTGSGGFELFMYNEEAVKIWNAILEAGGNEGIMPAGLGARDTLRLEMGYCLYGNDMDDNTSPLEAGLGWITKFVDNKPFIDRDFLENQKAEGIARRLTGIVMEEKGIPRNSYSIVDENGSLIGRVTSGTMSPVLKQGIGLGYINKEFAVDGKPVFIVIRNKQLKARVKRPPFI